MRATYRLQLGEQLDFAGAAELVPYLRELGISHLYLSPSLQATEGSAHGYDVVDPTRVSEALGGEAGLRELAAAGLPIVLDFVPNHMAASDQNRWWRDPQLRARFFDIDAATGFHRRFFDVDAMAAIRQEEPEVFETTHAKVLKLVEEGVLHGLRIDHVDGLADPAGYLASLAQRGVERVWVEKILSAAPPGEQLRDWPVCGTVGYEFLADAGALFIDADGEAELTELWADVSGERRAFLEVAREAKRDHAAGVFSREVERLVRLAPRFSFETLVRALSLLPVYRTYVQPRTGRVEAADVEAVEVAAGDDADLRDALLLVRGGGGERAARAGERVARAGELVVRVARAGEDGARADEQADEDGEVPDEFVVRFQQTSPAVAAKGAEDTALYRHLRLLALNEVGGDPDRFGISVEDFHAANLERARRFPLGLLASQTHDTKRSGDVRARIGALAGMAAQWRERVLRWHAIAADLRDGAAATVPDYVEEYLIYQTLVGVWPIEPARLDDYLEKALREAERHTNWLEPDVGYERAVKRFARALLGHRPFLDDFLEFLEQLLPEGERSALGQLLLKLTAPGVADIFQGDELWMLSLVDPDNRRSVDWEERRAALARVRTGGSPSAADAKLFLIWRALALRARRPDAFAGAYTPLAAGPAVCAYLRGDGEALVVVAVRPGVVPAASELDLPVQAAGRWRELLGERDVELGGAGGVVALERLGPGWRGMWLAERL
jgi:(1->4)-alpha-D-glucan 1-alpha-D-glucosylmutase